MGGSSMRNLFCLTFGVVALWSFTAQGASRTGDDRVRFCFNDWPPYSTAVDGVSSGLSVDILREAARRAAMVADFVALPWKRCLSSVESGENDAVLDAAERPEFVHGKISFSVYTNTFWVRGDDPLTSFDTSKLSGRRLGLVTGYVYGDTLEQLFADRRMIVDRSVNDSMNARKLGFGRTDIIVADFVSTRVVAAAADLDLRPLQPPHSFDRLYPSFNAGRRNMMLKIDKALKAMCADGYIQRAYEATLGIGIDAIAGGSICASGSLTQASR